MFEQPPPNKEIERVLTQQDVLRKLRKTIESEFLVGERAWERPLLKQAVVSYLDQPVVEGGEPLQDVLRRPFDLHLEGSQGILLLADPQPDANWGHLCWVATYDVTQDKLRVIESSFPPQESANKRLRTYATLAPCLPRP